MVKRHARQLLIVTALFIVVVLSIVSGVLWRESRLSLYREFPSPDGNFRVRVMRQESFLPLMPGQSGDAQGKAQLVDRNNRVLAEAKLEMVQLVDDVDWSDGHARIQFIADWNLSEISRRQ